MEKKSYGKHAIVIGASIAGLAAARVLSDYYEQVTVIDRDDLPDEVTSKGRKCALQGNHGHALLTTGYEVIQQYFPGLIEEMIADNRGLSGDFTGDVIWHMFNHWKLRSDSDVKTLTQSRAYLEAKIRKFVRGIENVTIIDKHSVVEPKFEVKRGEVQGVLIENCITKERREIDADLVIDAGGRASQSAHWIESWGYGKVEEFHLKMDVEYVTYLFERKPEDLYGNTIGLCIVGKAPDSKRSGYAFAIRDNVWMTSVNGKLGDFPPKSLEGFKEYARGLPTSALYDLVKDREPLSERFEFKHSGYRRLFYEKLKSFPKGYLLMGDAICTLNPMYGQGMTVSLSEAKALDECLQEGIEGLSRRYLSKVSKIIDAPSEISMGEDLRFPENPGKRTLRMKIVNRYVAAMHHAAQRDPVVLKRFFEVSNLVRHPASLFSPNIFFRVLMGGFGKLQGEPTEKL